MVRHLLNLFLWLLPPSGMFGLRRFCLRLANIDVGRGVSFCGHSWIYGRGRLQIGDNTWLSPGAVIYTHGNADIKIGERCDIGPGTQLIVGGHSIGPTARRAGAGTALPICIGNGCWIGAGTRVLGGVTIGDGAVIGAGAVVIEDVPPNTLAAGVPAKFKRALAE